MVEERSIACNTMKRLIDLGKQDIQNKEQQVRNHQSEIDRLEKELTNDRLQQQAMEDEFRASCGPLTK